MDPFGLTGNIGCGKSTVSRLLLSHGDVLVLDSDRLAKEVISSNMNHGQINEILGSEVYAGVPDYKLIAQIIFSAPDRRRMLEEFIHPKVWEEIQRRMHQKPFRPICVVESALIFELGWERKFFATIVATCGEEEQIRRLKENRGMSMEEIMARKRLQLDPDVVKRRADYVVDTECPLQELQKRVDCLHRSLMWRMAGTL